MAISDKQITAELKLVLESYDKFAEESVFEIVMDKLDVSLIRVHRVSKQLIEEFKNKAKILDDIRAGRVSSSS